MVVDPSAGPIRFSSPVARNLNDGDSIYLLRNTNNNTTAVTYNAVVRYAITSSDHHITPQISIASKFVGPVDVRSPNTPSGRVILSLALPNRKLLKWLQKYIYMNWFHDVIGWSHISTVPIFSTPFTGFLFATSAGLAPLRRSGLTLI